MVQITFLYLIFFSVITPLKRKRGRPRKIKLDNEIKEVLANKQFYTKLFKERNFRIDENYAIPEQIGEELVISTSQTEQKFVVTPNHNENIPVHSEAYVIPNQDDVTLYPSSQNEQKFELSSLQNPVCNYQSSQNNKKLDINPNQNEDFGSYSSSSNEEKNESENPDVDPERKHLFDFENLDKDLTQDSSFNKGDKNSPKTKRRCTRSFNKENICNENTE